MEDLRYEKVTSGMKDFDKLKELYDTAFPPEERVFSLEEAQRYVEKKGGIEAKAVYDGEDMVGFYALTVNENYKYLQFIAVNPNIRSKGYGGRILTELLEENRNGIFFASIERPVPGKEGYEMKMRRQKFYERNGMITVDRPRIAGGVEFIIVTNKTGDEFERCYEMEMKEEKKQFAMANR